MDADHLSRSPGSGSWRSDASAWLRDRRLELGLITLVWAVVSAIVYLLAIGHVTPLRYQDEFLYWAMAKNFAAGDGMTWRGVATGLRSDLYPLLITPAFHIADSISGQYHAVHAINSVVITAVAYPAYLMARFFVDRKLALLAMAFALAVPAMNYAGLIGTEVLAYPLSTAAFGFMLLALIQPRARNAVFAFAFIGLAVYTRIQFVVFLPIFAAALVLVAAMRGRDEAVAYLKEQRFLLGLFGAALVLGLIAIAIKGEALVGVHIGIFQGKHLTYDNASFWSKSFLADVFLLTGIVPAIATFAMFGSRENRRDPAVGALLALALVAALAFVAQVAWFSATSPFSWRLIHVFYERYMFYIGPLFFTGLVVSFGRVKTVPAAITALVAVLIVSGFQSDALRVPFSYDSFGLSYVGFLMDAHDSWLPHVGMLLALLTAVLGAFYVLSTLSEKHDQAVRIGKGVAVGLALFVLVISQAKSWTYARLFSETALTLEPKPLSFVDQNTDQLVGMIVTEDNDPTSYFQVEFWNNRIQRMFVNRRDPIRSPTTYSPSCKFNWDKTGKILGTGCDVVPNAWYLSSPDLFMTLRDEVKVVQQSPKLPGNNLIVSRTPSRIFSFVDGRNVKTGKVKDEMTVWTYFDRPGRIRAVIEEPRRNVAAATVPAGEHVEKFKLPGARVTFVEVREGNGPWRSISPSP